MKKTITTLLLFMLLTTAYTQEYNRTIGIKLLPGIATVYDSQIDDANPSRPSISGGITIEQRLFKKLVFLETGLFFFNRGYKGNIIGVDQNGEFIGTFKSKEIQNYLVIPILARFKFNRFYTGLGVQANFYLNRKYTLEGTLLGQGKLPQQKNILLGAQIFGGYEFPLTERLFFDLELFVNPLFEQKLLNYGIGLGLKHVMR